MTDLETALRLLAIEEKWIQPFAVQDPFGDLALEGYLSLRPDHRYGALAITRVGGKPAPQRVLATPKIHYPFDRGGKFRFPPVAGIAIYEKLDGTNVLAYRYLDAEGGLHTTYKLRLFSVLRNSKWGPFLDMWKEMLARYPAIASLPEVNGCAVSFELYGSRNAHLVIYDQPLDCAVLFGLQADGTPLRPLDLDVRGVPTARLDGELDATSDPVAEYNRIREEIERDLEKLEDEKLRGSEGMVWYVTTARSELVLFKCKPESVEAVHWAGGINKEAVRATCWNLLETEDVLSFETLVPLLLEEYTQEEIDRFRGHIDDCIAEVNGELSFRQRVLEEYAKVGLTLAEDKGTVMRALSSSFKKNEMKKVYSLIVRYG
ncbi:MAG: RNA ligase family protein [Vicinamibacteria bacterium]